MPAVGSCSKAFGTLASARAAFLGLDDRWLVFLPHPMLTRTHDEVVNLAQQTARRMFELVTGQVATGSGPKEITYANH